ncbi:hypothetical protein D3C86_1136350 [compost metagenome]
MTDHRDELVLHALDQAALGDVADDHATGGAPILVQEAHRGDLGREAGAVLANEGQLRSVLSVLLAHAIRLGEARIAQLDQLVAPHPAEFLEGIAEDLASSGVGRHDPVRGVGDHHRVAAVLEEQPIARLALPQALGDAPLLGDLPDDAEGQGVRPRVRPLDDGVDLDGAPVLAAQERLIAISRRLRLIAVQHPREDLFPHAFVDQDPQVGHRQQLFERVARQLAVSLAGVMEPKALGDDEALANLILGLEQRLVAPVQIPEGGHSQIPFEQGRLERISIHLHPDALRRQGSQCAPPQT